MEMDRPQWSVENHFTVEQNARNSILQGAQSASKTGNDSHTNQEPRQLTLRRFMLGLGNLMSRLCANTKMGFHWSNTIIMDMYRSLLHCVGPQSKDNPTKPSSHTVVWTLFAFIFYLVFASLAVKFPTYKVKIAFISVTSLILAALACLIWRDLMDYSVRASHRMVPLKARLRPLLDGSTSIPKKLRQFNLHGSFHHDSRYCSILARVVP